MVSTLRKMIFLVSLAGILVPGFRFETCTCQGVSVNSSNAAPDPSAMLDVSSTSSPFKGLLITRLTTAQRNAIVSPANGLLIYNTDCQNFNYNAGTPAAPNWVAVNPALNAPAQPGSITGSATVCQGQGGVTYSVPAVTGNTYEWTYSGTGFSCTSGCTANTVTASFSPSATPGTLFCTPVNACGKGAPQTFAVSVSLPPTTANAGPDQLNLSGTTTTLMGNIPTSGTGLWTILSGTGGSITTPASPASQFTGVAGQSYVLAWTISNAPCAASSDQVTVSFANACVAGNAIQGGKVFYYDAGANKCYVAAATDQSTGSMWGWWGVAITGADGTAIGTGAQNTADIVTCCGTDPIAARICDNLVLNGYSDWFLPSKDELHQLFLQKSAVGGISDVNYWSSSEYDAGNAWREYMLTGYQNANGKDNIYNVRCVRSF